MRGAELRERGVSFDCREGERDEERRGERQTGGQGSNMLRREGVTSLECNLGAVEGERGRVRNLGVLPLVSE